MLFSHNPNISSALNQDLKKGSQKNILMNRNTCTNENNLLHITLEDGSLVVFTMNKIIDIMMH
jgi:hypothetical protein